MSGIRVDLMLALTLFGIIVLADILGQWLGRHFESWIDRLVKRIERS